MCGIAGILHLDCAPASPVLLKRMTDAIAHRGPDGEGLWTDEYVGLGHRRLAIIDLSPAGHQPMISRDRRYTLTYNGEVYNFREIRTDLESLGYQFHSQTDSEVVLNAWAEWGEDCVHHFNGMFAFAIWDRKCKRLSLARDRYGIKPLYWGCWNNVFLFGSEQKAILAHPAAARDVDREALLEYFTFQNIFTDRTLLKGLHLMPPGSIAHLDTGAGHGLQVKKYWDYAFCEPEGSVDAREYREELDRLMQQAVSRQLVADVELGSYLSGGMDSGTLSALASRELPNLKTFTCGFDLSSASGLELGYDERIKAEAMSAAFKTEHYEMVLKAGDMERVMPRLARHIEEPRVGQSYPNFYAAQLASKFVKVVLSGAGGDELFGGYPWRYYRAVSCNDFDDYVNQYYVFWQRLIDNRQIKNVFSPIWSDVSHVWTRDLFRDVFNDHEHKLSTPEDYINHSLCFEARTFLHGLLVVEDKLSMAHSLETRVPFLDNDLVDFAMRCPVQLKLNNLNEVVRINENESGDKKSSYFQRTKDGKQILRDVMSQYLPGTVASDIKQGFSAPDGSWFKGESIDFVKDYLLHGNPAIYEFMDRKSVENLIYEHLDGSVNRRLLIWSLLSTESFLREFT